MHSELHRWHKIAVVTAAKSDSMALYVATVTRGFLLDRPKFHVLDYAYACDSVCRKHDRALPPKIKKRPLRDIYYFTGDQGEDVGHT